METEKNLRILKRYGLTSFNKKMYCKECNDIKTFAFSPATPDEVSYWECEELNCKEVVF